MKQFREIIIVSLLLMLGAWLMCAQPRPRYAHASTVARDHFTQGPQPNVSAADFTARLPLAFEQNEGQTDSGIKFRSRQAGADVLLLPAEARLQLRDLQHPLQMKFVGANRKARIEGIEALPGHQNYLLGNNPA